MDTTRNTYIFICANVRAKGRACNNCNIVDSIYEYFKQAINKRRSELYFGRVVKINKAGCLGRCADGPNIAVFPDNVWYTYNSTSDIDEIINDHLIEGKMVNRLLVENNLNQTHIER